MRGFPAGVLAACALAAIPRAARAADPPSDDDSPPPSRTAPAVSDDDSETPAPPPPPRPRAVELTRKPLGPPGDSPDHETGSPPSAASTGSGFSFGSYGRVGLGIDGRGHEGYATNVVSHGSRLEEAPYLELDLYYGGLVSDKGDGRWRVVVAPAFNGNLFHYNGNFSSYFALRNGYVETEDLGIKGLHLWVGTRMLRGDDIYLFDYWPLDNLNTVGAGANLKAGHLELQLHGGLNRLDDPLQYQTVPVPARGLGPPGQAVVLDRPRSVASFKATYRFGKDGELSGAKLSLYGEFHYLPEGQQVYVTQQRTKDLPADYGWVAGAQLGGWLRPYTFANLFFRYAGGLGVYGDITLPRAVDQNNRSINARELVLALSLNWETRWIGIMGGAFYRAYTDPGPATYNANTYVEGIVSARPQVFLSKYFHIAAELSFQERQYGGFDQLAGRRLVPKVFRASLLPIVSPNGRGTYMRPIIYAVGTVSSLDDDARLALFAPSDIRAGTSTVLYLGVGAEWWFQSSYR